MEVADEDGSTTPVSGARGSGRFWIIVLALACLVGLGAWIAHGRQARSRTGEQIPSTPPSGRWAFP